MSQAPGHPESLTPPQVTVEGLAPSCSLCGFMFCFVCFSSRKRNCPASPEVGCFVRIVSDVQLCRGPRPSLLSLLTFMITGGVVFSDNPSPFPRQPTPFPASSSSTTPLLPTSLFFFFKDLFVCVCARTCVCMYTHECPPIATRRGC